MREDDATIVYVRGDAVWVPETDCDKVTWTKEPPPRPPNGWPGVRYDVAFTGQVNVNGNLASPAGPAGGIVLAPWTITGIGTLALYLLDANNVVQGQLNSGFWSWGAYQIVRNNPIDPEPDPPGCLVKVLVDGNQYWWRQFSIPCSEIPVEKQCPRQCPPGWHKVILDRNTGKYCCCECPPV